MESDEASLPTGDALGAGPSGFIVGTWERELIAWPHDKQNLLSAGIPVEHDGHWMRSGVIAVRSSCLIMRILEGSVNTLRVIVCAENKPPCAFWLLSPSSSGCLPRLTPSCRRE